MSHIKKTEYMKPHITSNRFRLLAALLAAITTGQITYAGNVTVPDFSFEITPIAPGRTTGAPFVGTNWLASGNGGTFLQNITNTLFTPTSSNTLPPTADG